jgi:hypothetical protein
MYFLRHFRGNGVIIVTTDSPANISLRRVLKGSGDGVEHSELLGFRTLSIVRYSED